MPTEVSRQLLASYYADDAAYAASDNSSSLATVQDLLQPVLDDLERFCSNWRMGINPSKTWALNFFSKAKHNNHPRLWLKGELIKYHKSGKFLGATLDPKLSFKEHIADITARCAKRLRLLKALTGQDWGVDPKIIMYTYQVYIRPIMEYAAVIISTADPKLLHKLTLVETRAIKIAFRLPSWTLQSYVYKLTNIEPIKDRIKRLASDFIRKNSEDPHIADLLDSLPTRGQSLINKVIKHDQIPIVSPTSPN